MVAKYLAKCPKRRNLLVFLFSENFRLFWLVQVATGPNACQYPPPSLGVTRL
jgi:hypothetical protein